MIDLAEDFASDIWLILRLERFTIARSSSATCSAPSSASLKQLSLADRIRGFRVCCCSSSEAEYASISPGYGGEFGFRQITLAASPSIRNSLRGKLLI